MDSIFQDDPLVVIGRQCNFVYFFLEQLVPMTSNDIHRPHLCLSRKQTRLVIFKINAPLDDGFLNTLAAFLLFPLVHLVRVQLCPQSYTFSDDLSTRFVFEHTYNILVTSNYPRNLLWENYSYTKIRAHHLKCPCKNLLFQYRMLNCRYL